MAERERFEAELRADAGRLQDLERFIAGGGSADFGTWPPPSYLRFGLWDDDLGCLCGDPLAYSIDQLVAMGLGAIGGTWPDRAEAERRMRRKAEDLRFMERAKRNLDRFDADRIRRLDRCFGLPEDGSVDSRTMPVDELVAAGMARWDAEHPETDVGVLYAAMISCVNYAYGLWMNAAGRKHDMLEK